MQPFVLLCGRFGFSKNPKQSKKDNTNASLRKLEALSPGLEHVQCDSAASTYNRDDIAEVVSFQYRRVAHRSKRGATRRLDEHAVFVCM